MGRSLTNSSGLGVGQGVFNVKTGVAVAVNDLLEFGPDGRAYPVQVTDCAAVANVTLGTAQTNAGSGQIVAQTQVVAVQTPAYSRQAVLQGDDGSIFTFTRSAANTGTTLSKYSPSGALILQIPVDAGASDCSNHHLFKLTNGNICAVAHAQTGNVSFAIYDQNLVVVKSLTAVAEAVQAAAYYFSACALAAGGFAIVYQQNANPLLSRLVTYDNAGTVVQAPTTIWTRAGASAVQYHRMAQLSNGNLVVACSSYNTGGDVGLYHGIVTTAGVAVLPFTNLDATLRAVIPELSVMAGYYAVAQSNATNQLAFVFNNAGALQGAGFSAATAAGNGEHMQKLVNDGTAFWLLWPRSADNKEVLTKLPITGAGYVTTIVTTSNTTNYSGHLDAFYENGLIVGVFHFYPSPTNAASQLFVISTATGLLVSNLPTAFGVAPGTDCGRYPRLIPGGDFSFISLYDYVNAASTNLCVGKYANTAVIGVAQAAAAAGGLALCAAVAGGYAANYVKGSPSKQFDHSATNIYGNKGALMNYGAVLKGF